MKKQKVFCLQLIILSFLVVFNQNVFAQSMSVDTSFNFVGVAHLDVLGHSEGALVAVSQPDGKILLGGSSYYPVAGYSSTVNRFNADGSVDSSFGTNGCFRGLFERVVGIGVLPDGKIIAALSTGTLALMRLTPDGAIDSTFDNDGYKQYLNTASEVGELLVTPDGKILVVGIGNMPSGAEGISVVRINSSGSLDASFNTTGYKIFNHNFQPNNDANGYALCLQPDGKILVGGNYRQSGTQTDFLIARLNTDGTFDNTFNNYIITSLTDVDKITCITMQPDGKIIAAGVSKDNANFSFTPITRFLSNGQLDSSFSGNGKLLIPGYNFISIIPLQGGDMLLAKDVPTTTGTNFTKIKNDGTIDSTFATNGTYFTPVIPTVDFAYTEGCMVQADSKIITVGYGYFNGAPDIDFAAIRYNVAGVVSGCSSMFTLTADTIPHNWIAINQSTGLGAITYAWDWGDGSPLSLDATPSHTYAAPGYYNICLNVSTGNGCSASYCDSSVYLSRGSNGATMVTVNVQLPLSINEPTLNEVPPLIYPNPSQGNFTIDFSRTIKNGSIEVYSVVGQKVFSKKLDAVKSNLVQLPSFLQGIYMARIFDGSKIFITKIIVK